MMVSRVANVLPKEIHCPNSTALSYILPFCFTLPPPANGDREAQILAVGQVS